MKHRIRFEWDHETAEMIVDSVNARYLHRLASQNEITILEDSLVHSAFYNRICSLLHANAVSRKLNLN